MKVAPVFSLLFCATLTVAACSESPISAPATDMLYSELEGGSGVGDDVGILPEYAFPTSASARVTAFVAARVQTFPVVLVRSGPGAANSTAAGAPVVDNLSDAAMRVAPGGVIRIFTGTYTAEGVVIDRAVTIEPMPNAKVVIQVPTEDSNGFDVIGAQSGVVTFRQLNFNVGATARSAIMVFNSSADLVVENSNFDLETPNPAVPSGPTAAIEGGGGAVGTVTVRGNRIRGGWLSVFGYSGRKYVVRDNAFIGQTFGSVQFQSGGIGHVENNTFTGCGLFSCVRAFQSAVDVVDNTIEESRTNVNGFNHNLVLFSAGSTGTVADNEFNGCGFGQCVTVINRAVVDITRNTFTIPHAHNTRFVIAGSDGTVGAQPNFAARAPTLTITDNVIRGVGGNPTNTTSAQNFAIRHAGILVENAAIGHVYRNTIENAWVGINGGQSSTVAGSDGGNIEGSDNKTNLTSTGVVLFRGSQAVLRRNDITNSRFGVQLNFTSEPSDLTCNYYGGVATRGNTFNSSATAATWTPWATAPVAGTSVTSCSGV